jgi:hypothetical protein
MTIGTVFRICIVVGWLALFGSHALHYALPDLGLQERHDFAAVMAANLERSFDYRMMQESRGQARQVGTCRLVFARSEADYTLETMFDLTDPGLAPAIDALLPARAGPRSQRIMLKITETLDDRLRLVAVQADASLHGHRLSAHGAVGGAGLTGTWEMDGGAPTPFGPLAGVTQDTNQGLDAAISLPPGLEPGDRFTSHLVDPDLVHLAAQRKVAVFIARAREEVATLHGTLELLRVDMEVDGHPSSTLWCDRAGTVYRSRQAGSGMQLMLDRTSTTAGTVLWPAAPTAAGRQAP